MVADVPGRKAASLRGVRRRGGEPGRGRVAGALEHFYRATTDVNATWLDLDDEAYAEVAALLNTLFARAQELHAESAPRLAGRSPSERHATALMIMQVHRTPGDG